MSDRSEWDVDDEFDDDDEECPICLHGASNHDEAGCDVPGCECTGP